MLTKYGKTLTLQAAWSRYIPKAALPRLPKILNPIYGINLIIAPE